MNEKNILFTKDVKAEVRLLVYLFDLVWYLTEYAQRCISEETDPMDMEEMSRELDNALGPVRYWAREVIRHHGGRSSDSEQESRQTGEPQAPVAPRQYDGEPLPGAHVGPNGEESPFSPEEPKAPQKGRRRFSKAR